MECIDCQLYWVYDSKFIGDLFAHKLFWKWIVKRMLQTLAKWKSKVCVFIIFLLLPAASPDQAVNN